MKEIIDILNQYPLTCMAIMIILTIIVLLGYDKYNDKY